MVKVRSDFWSTRDIVIYKSVRFNKAKWSWTHIGMLALGCTGGLVGAGLGGAHAVDRRPLIGSFAPYTAVRSDSKFDSRALIDPAFLLEALFPSTTSIACKPRAFLPGYQQWLEAGRSPSVDRPQDLVRTPALPGE